MMEKRLWKRLRQSVQSREDRLLLLYAIIVFFGGALRKWFIDSSVLANLVLMVQLCMPFIWVVLRSPGSVSPFRAFPILYLYFGYLVFHIVYPMQPTVYHGMLGILVYGGFWLGLFYYLANRHKFFTPKLIPYFIIFTAGEIVLGFIQYQLPQGHFLNKYALDVIQNIAVVGDSVRITGTFSYISGYGSFVMFLPFFIWALTRLNYSLWLIALAISMGLVGAFMTGSRGAVLVYLAYTGVIVVSLYSLKDIGSLVSRLFLPAVIGIAIIIGIGDNPIKTRIEKSYENFMDRLQRGRESGEQAKRLTWDFRYFENLDRFPNIVTGIGLGSTYQGAVILFGPSKYAKQFGYVEGEFVKSILEGGMIYYLLKLILATIAVLHFSFRQPLLRWLMWFSLAYGIPIIFNVHNAAFLLMGLILIDNIVWRQEQKERMVSPAPPLPEEPPFQLKGGYPQVGDPVAP